jgi:hypothetical protein
MALTSCGGGSQETKTPANSTPNVIEGRFDVGDYKLYMHCEGSGSPTVVYLHGTRQPRPSANRTYSSGSRAASMTRASPSDPTT